MAKARAIPDLHAATRFGDAAAAAVEVRAKELFEHSEGVLDSDDIERVHDMRVASRRLRAALEVFAPCFPKKQHKALLREVKDLAAALGERRDPDVAIAALERAADELSSKERPGIEGLVGELRERQSTGNELLSRALAEAEGLEARLLELARSARRAGEPA